MTLETTTRHVLERLSSDWDALTPEARKAARYVLENPRDVGVSTVREIAEAAEVSPNTMVRMSRQVGFDGYEDFRQPFKEALRRGDGDFPDRARWLQQHRDEGALGALYSDMMSSALHNLEETFARTDANALAAAARAICDARNVHVLGMGVNNANARNFAYLASTGLDGFSAIPRAGSVAGDDLSRATAEDVLIAMTCKPYRREVVDSTLMAQQQGVTLIALSDSPASPIVRAADHAFVVAADTPQFFPSSATVVALLEVLLSFVIAAADASVIDRVDAFHARRRAQGLYLDEDS